MARRRRAKNNLLAKMIGIAVLLNAILLPILATLGVFKPKKGQQLMDVKLVKLPPEKKIAQKKPPKKKEAKAKPHPTSRHQADRTAQARPSRPNPNQPKVVATAPGNGSGPSIENNGTGKAGIIPTGPAPSTASTKPPEPTPAPQPQPEQHPTPPVTTPSPLVAPPPHEPVFAEAVPVDQPQPEIPDDLAGQELHTSFMGLFTIHPDGTADVKMVKSTGNDELDHAALDAARKWTFKPGMKDGHPVESYRRLRIDIDVS